MTNRYELANYIKENINSYTLKVIIETVPYEDRLHKTKPKTALVFVNNRLIEIRHYDAFQDAAEIEKDIRSRLNADIYKASVNSIATL
jgi:hypothetical protein